MTYSVQPEAEEELVNAAAFYRQAVNLRFAARFLDEFDRAALLLDENRDLGRRMTCHRGHIPSGSFRTLWSTSRPMTESVS